jgi:HK97 family phage major capsid protein
MPNMREKIHGDAPADDEMIYIGDAIKSLDGGKVGGYLVRFSDATSPDLQGDYFTKDTDFGPATESIAWFHHRQKAELRNGKTMPALKKPLSHNVSLKRDEFGVWAETVLDLRDEYEKFISDQVRAGKMNWSSGTASHTVDREPVGKGVFQITRWPLGTDASFTPAPAEYHNQVIPIKSLTTLPGGVERGDDGNEQVTQPIQSIKEHTTMEPNEVKAAVDAALAERDAAAKAKADHDAEIKAAEENGAKKAVEEMSKKFPKTQYHTTKARSDSDDGVLAFKSWLATGETNHELISPESRWEGKSAYNVTTGAAGAGYLVPDPLYQQIIAKRTLASWARRAPVQSFSTPADHLLVPRESTSATAFVLTAEAGAYDENEPTLTQKDLILFKYTKLIKMSEEFINYEGTNFDAWLTQVLARAEAVTENTIFTNGNGAGAPEGIATNATKANASATNNIVLPSEVTTLIGKLGAGYNTGAQECGFLMANASKWYLHGVQTTGFFAFINTPAPGPAGSPYGGEYGSMGFLGYPAYVSDDLTAVSASASNTSPDIIFANFNFYGIVEKPGLLIQRNPYLYMANGQVGIFATMFRGGGTLQTEAVQYLAAHT